MATCSGELNNFVIVYGHNSPENPCFSLSRSFLTEIKKNVISLGRQIHLGDLTLKVTVFNGLFNVEPVEELCLLVDMERYETKVKLAHASRTVR